MANESAPVPITPLTRDTLAGWLEQNPARKAWVEATGFKGEPASLAFVPASDGTLERVLAAPAEADATWGLAGLPRQLPPALYTLDAALDEPAATSAALGWALGSYSYRAYKAAGREPARLQPPAHADMAEVRRLADAIGLSRDLVNAPAEDMGPQELADAAQRVAQAHGAQLRVVRGDALLQENYPCIHAVGRASARPPALVDFRWGREDAPRVTLVGKGVCFDTGGLDLKPAAGMLGMKKDMGGAAIVLGLAQALMAAEAPLRLRVMIPAVENSVGGNAYRPRDILRTRSGKTVEVTNTDAEGRLVLCDALWEADGESPDLLVDCATLTGASRAALGPSLQALFCDDDEAAAQLQATALRVGDPLWRLPIWREYRKDIEGKWSDLTNVSGSPHGGAIVAAVYLAEFVSRARTWMHLDVGAFNDKPRPGRPEGGEATGLRALYTWIRARYG